MNLYIDNKYKNYFAMIKIYFKTIFNKELLLYNIKFFLNLTFNTKLGQIIENNFQLFEDGSYMFDEQYMQGVTNSFIYWKQKLFINFCKRNFLII